MKKNLQIYTATFIEKFPGFIYIEADREIHVREAIKDLNGTQIKGRCYVKIIPVKEVARFFDLMLGSLNFHPRWDQI